MTEPPTREFAERMLYVSNLFASILPIYSESQRRAFSLAFEVDIAEIIPKFFMDAAAVALRHQDEALPYLKFIHEATGYALGYTDKKPEVETSDIAEMETVLQRQLVGWRGGDMDAKVQKQLAGYRCRDD